MKILLLTNVKSYFSKYELKDVDDANNSVYMISNDKTYYIVPFGVGMESCISVISDIQTNGNRTLFSVKTYKNNDDDNNYTYVKTTTFEIETNGLKVYSFNVQK